MVIEIVCLEPEKAEEIGLELLSAEPESDFFRVFDRTARDESCVLFRHDGAYVGFATITAEETTCEIYRFFITPARRGAGLGTKAARELEALLKGDGYTCCFLQIDDERKFNFWQRALGSLEIANETSNMYRRNY